MAYRSIVVTGVIERDKEGDLFVRSVVSEPVYLADLNGAMVTVAYVGQTPLTDIKKSSQEKPEKQ